VITIQYGGWTPDIAQISFMMPDQLGPVTVPVADCLNVYFANGLYLSLPSRSSVAGSPTLAGQCTGAFTLGDATGLPIPCAGVLNGNAYYWNGSIWNLLLNTGFTDIATWNFCEFGTQVFVQPISAHAYEMISSTAGVGNNLYLASPGGGTTPSPIVGAYYGTVMAVVGQFVMIGDLAGLIVGDTLGTGNGVQTTFSSILGSSIPIYPGSVTVIGGAGQFGTDNGAGVISGTGITSGTINYDTGVVSVTFTTAVPNLTAVIGRGAPASRSRLQWGPIGNANPAGGWPTPLTNAALAVQSGINDLESQYGPIMFIAGYPLYGVIFQRNAITRASYIGGNVVFSWQTYARNQGLLAKGAAVQVGTNTYFLSDAGFFYTDGANVVPIGTAQDNSAGIDGWFFANVNKAALGVISAGYDALKRSIFFAIPTGSHTLPDTLLTYNILAGRWTRSAYPSEFIWIDSDGSTDRLGLFSQSHAYSLLTGAPSVGYLESVDLCFADGLTRDTNGVRPNGAFTSPTVTVGTRNTLSQAVTYNAGYAPDAFGAGFAPALTEGLYTRIRVLDTNATSIQGATCDMAPAGEL
jgi:hypothetical protein